MYKAQEGKRPAVRIKASGQSVGTTDEVLLRKRAQAMIG
jgi:hypothetical protein